MRAVVCQSCGSNDVLEENGYLVCRYCGTKHLMTADEKKQYESSIELRKDVERLLQKCRDEPSNAAKYAKLVLDIDPTNKEALRYTQSQSGGCYVATAVYGSYDCPEVWTLRRFRDGTLAKSLPGRGFIRFYYAVSPTLVRRFGETGWFRRLWKTPLDALVASLRKRGVSDTPYCDR
ncbi:MAG: TFIIB-type zinc finger domain-containing protein [Oscillospiraceae bacterium]|nr:TFIIB-type zinc finger domain-containing protein [Oscillospiraceae bacterium]